MRYAPVSGGLSTGWAVEYVCGFEIFVFKISR